MWKLWYPNYKKQYCTAQEEMPSWNLVLYSVSQFLHYFPGCFELSYCLKRQHPKNCRFYKHGRCYQEYPGFYALRHHKNTQHGFPIKTADVDPKDIFNENDDANLKDELRFCQKFSVNYELETARHKVFHYAVDYINETIVNEKHDLFFNTSKCAAEVNHAFGFILKNIGGEGFRYF